MCNIERIVCVCVCNIERIVCVCNIERIVCVCNIERIVSVVCNLVAAYKVVFIATGFYFL